MTTNNKPKKKLGQDDFIVRLIETLTEALIGLITAFAEALAELITTSASTIVVLGLLVILAMVILQATPEMQRQIIPSLVGVLNVVVYHLLASRRTAPPKPPDAPGAAE